MTQDEDIEPNVFDSVTHELHRAAEDSAEDELFDSLAGHDWEQDVLMFKILWNTG